MFSDGRCEATAVGHANIVALLLMSRADPDYRSPQGMVARQMALEPAALLLDLCLGDDGPGQKMGEEVLPPNLPGLFQARCPNMPW